MGGNLHIFLLLALFGCVYQSQSHIATDGQSVSKFWCRAPSGLMTRYLFLFDS
jgi:hypothetical protein